MLGYLTGKTISKNAETLSVVVLASQVGYEVVLSRPLFDATPRGVESAFWIHTIVREDQITYFGFQSEVEKYFYKLLLGVSGLGPKTALALLGEFGVSQTSEFILNKDARGLSQAPGVGKKTAERICLDLSTKLEKWSFFHMLESTTPKKVTSTQPLAHDMKDDLNSALLNLGYHANHIKTALERIAPELEEDGSFENAFKLTLRELSANKFSPREPVAHG